MTKQFKPLSDKTTATSAIIKDSELNDYLGAHTVQGRAIAYISNDGTVTKHEMTEKAIKFAENL